MDLYMHFGGTYIKPKLSMPFSQKLQVVAQELGENVNIQSCLNNPSSWRGRAQQIIALQQKVLITKLWKF